MEFVALAFARGRLVFQRIMLADYNNFSIKIYLLVACKHTNATCHVKIVHLLSPSYLCFPRWKRPVTLVFQQLTTHFTNLQRSPTVGNFKTPICLFCCSNPTFRSPTQLKNLRNSVSLLLLAPLTSIAHTPSGFALTVSAASLVPISQLDRPQHCQCQKFRRHLFGGGGE